MKKRIFVVDDDASVRESLRKVLVDAGHQVFVAEDGLEAQTVLQGTGVDLMILDINMPVRDGWDVLEDLRAKHPSLPVVMITGIYDQLETTVIPGVRVLLEKPLEVELLLKTVEGLLGETEEESVCRAAMGSHAVNIHHSGQHNVI